MSGRNWDCKCARDRSILLAPPFFFCFLSTTHHITFALFLPLDATIWSSDRSTFVRGALGRMPAKSGNTLIRVDELSSDQIRAFLASYPSALSTKASSSTTSASSNKSKDESLEALDAWYQALPTTLNEDTEKGKGLGSREELIRLMRWKLKREKHRPTLLSLISSNHPTTCKDVLQRAFAHLQSQLRLQKFTPPSSSSSRPSSLSCALMKDEDVLLWGGIVEGTMKILMELKGVGPATSSAIVATWTPWGVFQSDELVQNLFGKGCKIDYTLSFYRKFYREACKALNTCRHNNSNNKEEMGEGGVVSGRTMEMVAWSMFHSPHNPSAESVATLERSHGSGQESDSKSSSMREGDDVASQNRLSKRKIWNNDTTSNTEAAMKEDRTHVKAEENQQAEEEKGQEGLATTRRRTSKRIRTNNSKYQ